MELESHSVRFGFGELQERLTGHSLWSNMRGEASDLGVLFRAFGEKKKALAPQH